jgi:hypothetical protein
MTSVGENDIYIHRGNSLSLDRIGTGRAINFSLSNGRTGSEFVNVVCIVRKILMNYFVIFSFGNPHRDHLDILAPLYQCCV